MGKDAIDVRVNIEGYAFAAKGSSIAQLHEAGGALKHKLHALGYTWSAIPPSQVKKAFAGSGRSTKVDMYNAFVKKTNINLLNDFQLSLNKNGLLPCPVQDMVDAYA